MTASVTNWSNEKVSDPRKSNIKVRLQRKINRLLIFMNCTYQRSLKSVLLQQSPIRQTREETWDNFHLHHCVHLVKAPED